jgi:hypothetical protein
MSDDGSMTPSRWDDDGSPYGPVQPQVPYLVCMSQCTACHSTLHVTTPCMTVHCVCAPGSWPCGWGGVGHACQVVPSASTSVPSWIGTWRYSPASKKAKPCKLHGQWSWSGSRPNKTRCGGAGRLCCQSKGLFAAADLTDFTAPPHVPPTALQ